MAEERLQRRLAAIMSADVVGYSRLMGTDEAGTLSRLNILRRQFIDPAIAAHSGRIVKLMGDGALVEFASAVDAVTCAIEIQRQLREHDVGGSVANPIRFRIGINVGDIIIEGDDILRRRRQCRGADRRNCGTWRYLDFRGRLAAGSRQGGGQLRRCRRASLKNIARPVRVFRLDLAPKAATASEAPRPLPTQSDKPSIAVLAFNNMSGDPEQEYFSDGISEDIITDLSKLSELQVIARNSTFTYKGKPVDVSRSVATSACATCWKAVCARRVIGSALPASSSTPASGAHSGPTALIATLPISSPCRTNSPRDHFCAQGQAGAGKERTFCPSGHYR